MSVITVPSQYLLHYCHYCIIDFPTEKCIVEHQYLYYRYRRLKHTFIIIKESQKIRLMATTIRCDMPTLQSQVFPQSLTQSNKIDFLLDLEFVFEIFLIKRSFVKETVLFRLNICIRSKNKQYTIHYNYNQEINKIVFTTSKTIVYVK